MHTLYNLSYVKCKKPLQVSNTYVNILYLTSPPPPHRQDTSAGDYLQLCDHFHTILLSHIPRMGLATKDAARRFIVFVDTLYDRKVGSPGLALKILNELYVLFRFL